MPSQCRLIVAAASRPSRRNRYASSSAARSTRTRRPAIARGRPPAVPRRRFHYRDAGRGLSARARHYRASRLAVAALSRRAVVQARRHRAPGVLARTPRRRHRSCRPDHWRASHLARSRASRQGGLHDYLPHSLLFNGPKRTYYLTLRESINFALFS
jgi:hypothetical protein